MALHLLMKNKLAASLLALVSLSILMASRSAASDSGNSSEPKTTQISSANDFDWQEVVPALATAAELPADQGVKELLENCNVLRSYIAAEVRAECISDKNMCAATADKPAFERQVTARIDGIVAKEISTKNKTAMVDYTFSESFPFSEVAAYRSQNRPDAYLTLAPADRSYTSSLVKARYGEPFDDDVFQWHGVYKYRLDKPEYRSEAVFEIDPTNDAVVKITISFKPKKHHGDAKAVQP
jgi:hypothetical protein